MGEWSVSDILLLIFSIYLSVIQSINVKFFRKDIKRKDREIENYQKQIFELIQRENELLSRLKEKEFHEKLYSGSGNHLIIEKERGAMTLSEKIQNPMNNPLNDNDWTGLQRSIDEIYSNYTLRLKNKFPKLSENDCRLLYLFKLNLDATTISYLLNTSIPNVGNMRYRIKKKLDLNGEDFKNFLHNF